MGLVAALLGTAVPAGLAAERPNVLVIIGDDHAPYVFGAYGNKQVRTPSLDRLAAQGVRFNRAYCNSPMCTPSRQSFLTGKLPHTVGVTLLRTALKAREVTLADILSARGYETRAIGKMHFNSRLTHGFDRHIDGPEHRAFLKAQAARPLPEDLPVLPRWRPFKDHARVWLNGFYRPLGRYDAEMQSTFLANEAAAFIKAKRDAPYLLFVSFREPHSPFHFPVEYAKRYDPQKMPVGRVGPEDDGQIPAIFRDLTDAEKRGIVASYYTSVTFLDKNIGLVLDALDRSGQADRTLVVYLGDHGYSLGHHGRFEKHCFYEPAVRSPLMFRFPNRYPAGEASDALVEFADIVPTVLDVCGVPAPTDLWGRSVNGILSGESRAHRDFIFSEYLENEEAMIRTAQFKFIYTRGKRERKDGYATGRPLPGRTRRLYDVVADPDEMHNLAAASEHEQTVAKLEARMLDVFARTQRPGTEPPPPNLRGADLLDWYLVPRDK